MQTARVQVSEEETSSIKRIDRERSSTFGASTVADVLQRLADATDERSAAVTLLLLLRLVSMEWSGAVLGLCAGKRGKTVLTLEDAFGELSIAEYVRVTPAAVAAAIDEFPALIERFMIVCESATTLVLRTRPAPTPTPVELPSLDLLVRAGLLSPDVLRDVDD